MKTTTNRRKLDSTFRNDSLSSDQSECLQQQRPPPPKPHKHKQKGVAGNNSQSASHSHSSQQSLISAQQHQSQHQQQRQAHQQIYRQIFFRSHFFTLANIQYFWSILSDSSFPTFLDLNFSTERRMNMMFTSALKVLQG